VTYDISRAAVIGAGIMGSGIAAHLANVGIPVTLLDIVPPDATQSSDRAARNRIAQTGLDRALKARPASAFYVPQAARRVTIGNIEDDFDTVGEADWIVEAVFERLDVKHDIFARIDRARKPDSIVSSNTSGLPAHLLVEGHSADFGRHFLVTHFFNPVRFLKLLELAPAPQTDPAIMAFMGQFGTERLGKGVVYCKDTPNFIGNRIGTYGFMATLHRALSEGYGFEEVDAIFGPVLGRAKSAVFRTADIAGIDTLVHVADNLYENLPSDSQRAIFRMPDFVREMVKRGWTGDKGGQGFYKKVKGGGESEILVIDPATLDYRPQAKVRFPSIGAARENSDLTERTRIVLSGDDRASQLAWEVTADSLLYTAAVAEEIAEDIVNIDRAMRWGFNWEAGPFEGWDGLGVRTLAERMTAEAREAPSRGPRLPPLVERVLAAGGSFYSETPTRGYFDFTSGAYKPVLETGAAPSLTLLKKAGKVVKENAGASLIDFGDGLLFVEFHTKMNAIDDSLNEMLAAAVQEAQRNWRAVVVGNDAPDFSVGANLLAVLWGAKSGMWAEIERGVNGLQQANLGLKYSPVPVVVAPAGRVLGGGCEIVMHGQHVRAAAETYLGLVEVGAGVIPAGGGCKELLARWQGLAPERGPFAASRHAFELIAVATVSTSAAEAQQYGFLRTSDAITLDRERLLADAKRDALALADRRDRGDWRPPEPPTFRLPGAGGRLVLEQVVDNLRLQGKASEHDAVVAGKLAYVLTGGDCSPLDTLSEQQILDLEREAFLSLCGLPKSQDRMEALLTTGKPLRN
jgi:3-hydroxyacyl-CoA dehydrogenase